MRTESGISLDTYVQWEIVFVICRQTKTALSLLCKRHKNSVAHKYLAEKKVSSERTDSELSLRTVPPLLSLKVASWEW